MLLTLDGWWWPVTSGVQTSIVTAEQLRIRAGGRDWTPDQFEDATRILVEAEGDVSALLGSPPISPLAARVETAPILCDGLVCPRWPVHTVTSIGGTVVDDDHPLGDGWLLEDGYLTRVGTDAPLGINTPGDWRIGTDYAYTAGTIQLGYRPGWGDVHAIRSMITRIALARTLNSHDDTMIARDLQAEAPPPVREPTADEIRTKLGLWRWLQVRR